MQRARAEDWFEVTAMGEGVTRIREPFLKDNNGCNIWLIDGSERAVLIDTGLGVVPVAPLVRRLTDRPVILVCSHSHFDHLGDNHVFQTRLGHRAEADIFAHPTRAATVADPFLVTDLFSALPPGPFEAESHVFTPAPLTGYLEDGDRIDLGNRTLSVLHTPGHSPGGIALFEAQTGLFFSGDIVYDGELYDDLYHSDTADYVVTMKRLHDLPVTTVHPGHCGSYDADRHRTIIRQWLSSKGHG